jgi:hypothetical protein
MKLAWPSSSSVAPRPQRPFSSLRHWAALGAGFLGLSSAAAGCFFPADYTFTENEGGGGTTTTTTTTTGAPVCDPGKADCNTDGSDGCETDITTVNDCGTCGKHCNATHATPGCTGGKCTIKCFPGFDDCDGDATTGCEAETGTDVFNCGTCGLKCGDNHASPKCVAAKCTLTCSAGWGDCNMDPADGCETDLNTTEHCGKCDKSCGSDHATASCNAGACKVTCAPGFGDCDLKPETGCETDLKTLTDCGVCGTPCSFPHATASCDTGTCQLVECTMPFDNCDVSTMNGCEKDTSADKQNCGACGNICGSAHALSSCDMGTCNLQCAAGFGDCDLQTATGCETTIQNNINACGSCGKVCAVDHGTPDCVGMNCTVKSCTPPYNDCNGVYMDGCEANFQNDVNNCGACNKKCTNNNGTAACIGSVCVPTCAAGFSSCDGNAQNGCETATDTVTNCGGCGVKCNSINGTASCMNNACAFACNGTFKNCDSNGVNGCETNSATDKNNCGGCGTVCSGQTPYCINSSCQACPADADEPNESIQAPFDPPMGPTMRVLDQANNIFPMQPGRTVPYTFTFTTDADVDVHYFNVTDNLTVNQVAGFEFTLSNIPPGAVYELETYYFCNKPNSTAAFIYNTPAQWCDVNDPVKTGFFGNWWRCSNPAPAPSFNELFAVRCTDVATNSLIDDSGIMQVSVKMVTPPTAPNCSSYTLTVHVFANAQ